MRRVAVFILSALSLTPAGAQRASVSSKPDTPFKLATFEAAGKVPTPMKGPSAQITP
jgi:hypothetical protein